MTGGELIGLRKVYNLLRETGYYTNILIWQCGLSSSSTVVLNSGTTAAIFISFNFTKCSYVSAGW